MDLKQDYVYWKKSDGHCYSEWDGVVACAYGAHSPHLRPLNFDNRADLYWPCTAKEGQMHNHPPPTWDDWMAMLLNCKILCTQYSNYHWGTKRVIGTVRRSWPVTEGWSKRGMKKATHYWMLAVAQKSETEEEGKWREKYGLWGDLYGDLLVEVRAQRPILPSS